MKVTVYCEVAEKGKQAFYLGADNKKFLLFIQNYKKSNREFFAGGQMLDRALSTSGIRSTATLKTIERLRPAIRYIEKEYGISVLNGTIKKSAKKKQAYKRQKLVLGDDGFYAA